ncbi:Uncharacterised protein [uncultured archaeon]|nr:Uncharacterised protein [uncultured archaeon]
MPDIRRLPFGETVHCKEETLMPEDRVKRLFSGPKLIVEEKMNGTSALFHADGKRFIVFAEDMRICKPGLNTGVYRVPARFAVFDVFDTESKRFMCFPGKQDFFSMIKGGKVKFASRNGWDFFPVANLGYGMFTPEQAISLLDLKSRFAFDNEANAPAFMEGVVVKPARELFLVEYEDLVAKLVRNEFLFGASGIQENYRRLPAQYNQINPSFFQPGL